MSSATPDQRVEVHVGDDVSVYVVTEDASISYDRTEGEVLLSAYAAPCQRITHQVTITWEEWNEYA